MFGIFTAPPAEGPFEDGNGKFREPLLNIELRGEHHFDSNCVGTSQSWLETSCDVPFLKYWNNIIAFPHHHHHLKPPSWCNICKRKSYMCVVGNDKINKFVLQTHSMKMHSKLEKLGMEIFRVCFSCAPCTPEKCEFDVEALNGGKSIFAHEWRAMKSVCGNLSLLRWKLRHATHKLRWLNSQVLESFLFTCETIECRLLHQNVFSFDEHHDAEWKHHND